MSFTHLAKHKPRKLALPSLPAALLSLIAGPVSSPRMWTGLAWMDIVQSYRRTFLGPVWITLNMVIFTAAMTLIYGALFSVPTKKYAAYVACGMIAWFWASALLQEVGHTFLHYGYFIKGTSIDKAFFVWASVSKLTIVLAHHMVVYVGLVSIGVIPLSVYTLGIVPAFMVLFVISIPITAIAAILFSRYRDLSRLVSSSIIVLLMITPIFWQPQMLSGWRSAFVHLNPLYYFIEFIRTPLLGEPYDPMVVAVVLGMGAALWVVGSIIYFRYQRYVVFWI